MHGGVYNKCISKIYDSNNTKARKGERIVYYCKDLTLYHKVVYHHLTVDCDML